MHVLDAHPLHEYGGTEGGARLRVAVQDDNVLRVVGREAVVEQQLGELIARLALVCGAVLHGERVQVHGARYVRHVVGEVRRSARHIEQLVVDERTRRT